MGAVPGLVAANDAISPVPLAPNPMAVLEFVHAKVPPPGVLAKLVAPTLPLLQTIMSAGTVTVDIGVTVIV
jgi:hypothetical protein